MNGGPMQSSPQFPVSTAFARLPTPLQRLNQPAESSGEIWVKRDDMTGIELSGNKVRKLEYLIADAQSKEADVILTCGGIQSNHARATALCAVQKGLRCHLLLRGASPEVPSGNHLLGTLAGAKISWLTPEEYRKRDAFFESTVQMYQDAGLKCYVIPEGGSNPLGVYGYVAGYEETYQQLQEANVDARYIYTAVGSGGTLAGLLAGWVKSRRRGPRPIGVPVCDDARTFRTRIMDVLLAYHEAYGEPIPDVEEIELLDGWVGLGYAKSRPRELKTIRTLANRYGFFLDPVYTVKGWMGMEAHRSNRSEGNDIFLHTGGVFGLLATGGFTPDGPAND